MNLSQLKVFLTVTECESYSRAARQLYLSEPSVYMRVRALEKEYRCKLFETVERRVVPTKAGRALMEYATQFVRLEEDATWVMQSLKGDCEHSLAVAAGEMIGSYLLPRAIVAFRRRFPDVDLTLYNSPPGEEMPEYVLRYGIDLRLSSVKVISPYTVVEEFCRTDLVLCVGPGQRLARMAEVHVEDLAAEEFLWLRFGTNIRRTGEAALRDAGIRPKSNLALATPEAIKRVVMTDYGVALLPRPAVSVELDAGTIYALSIPGFRVEYPFFCIRHAARQVSPFAETFLELVKETAGAGLAAGSNGYPSAVKTRDR